MMKKIKSFKQGIFTAALLLFMCISGCTQTPQTPSTSSDQANAKNTKNTPQFITRQALFAIYANDPVLLSKTTWPTSNSGRALSGRQLTSIQKQQLLDEINAIDLTPLNQKLERTLRQIKAPDTLLGMPIHFQLQFQNRTLPLTLRYQKDEWRMDIRWFISANSPKDELIQAQQQCIDFLKALNFKQLDRLNRLCLPNKNLAQLASLPPDVTPNQVVDISENCENMYLVILKPGERFQALDGSWRVVPNLTQKRLVVIGMYANTPMPFHLFKLNTSEPYRIDSQPWFEFLKQSQ